MPEARGTLGYGAPRLGTAPYKELADPVNNAVDRWLERQLGRILAHTPFTRLRLRHAAWRVIRLQSTFEDWDDDALRNEAVRLRPALLRNERAEPELSRAFALVREVSWRTLGKRHYPVQIMGARALFEGRMVEMATGEGKTLTATPAAVVAALAGLPVHVVTVNDYLAARDAEENTPIFDFFGLSVGIIDSDMDPQARKEAYACHITYVSNKNLTFDYLRDRISLQHRRAAARRRTLDYLSGGRGGDLMLRGLAFAIVDEADSVFVDEARTPLILSSSADDPEANAIYGQALEMVRQLKTPQHYKIDLMNRQVTLEEAGKTRLAQLAQDLQGIWQVRKAREELGRQALSALCLFEHGKDYIIADDSIQIVDEYTGRVMADRSWQGGLHQMIEAKEGVEISGQKYTLARITYQRFFRRYVRLAGMTGTGTELAGEFLDTFGLPTVRIPRNRRLKRRHLRTVYLRTEKAKWARLAKRVAALHNTGQPVLIGTRSVEASEAAEAALRDAGLDPAVLNARQDAEEAAIVAKAGQRGAITVATNIAGRGTDIHLGDGVRELGGLHVILTEFHESSRIDRQLYGRAGRQGDPGTTEAIVSLEDELFKRFAKTWLRICKAIPAPGLCERMRKSAQARAEREHALTRREQTKLDKQMEKSLAFTGRAE